MRKILSILLVFTTLSATACGMIPEFSGSITTPTSDDQKNESSSMQTVSDSGGASLSESTGNPDAAPDGYAPVPADGDVSLLSFCQKRVPLTAEQIADCVASCDPDVFTVSDASKSLLDAVAVIADGYALIGEPSCEGGSYQAILYRESAVEAVKSSTVWLTSTPAEQSKQPGSESFDICTYALFTEKESGRQFAVFHASLSADADARAEEIICLYAKYACYKDYFPTILTGDLSGGDNSVLTAGGGLTKQSDELYTACMACTAAPVSPGGSSYGSYGSLTFKETPYKLDLSRNLVALTFDDGPRVDAAEHAYTEAVLNTLAAYGRKATFFVIGNRLGSAAQAELIRQEFAAGHEIGNHTYDHTFYSDLTADELMANLARTDEKVMALTGGIPTLVYRAPGGSNKTAAPLKRPLVNWSVDTEDWKSTATPDSVFEIFKKQIYAGGIVLMHDLHQNSPDALGTILTWLDENGYQAVTVSELFEFSDIQMDSNHAYYSTRNIKAR